MAIQELIQIYKFWTKKIPNKSLHGIRSPKLSTIDIVGESLNNEAGVGDGT